METEKEYRQKSWRKNNAVQNIEQQARYRKKSKHWKKYWRRYMRSYYHKNREKILAQRRERHALINIR